MSIEDQGNCKTTFKDGLVEHFEKLADLTTQYATIFSLFFVQRSTGPDDVSKYIAEIDYFPFSLFQWENGMNAFLEKLPEHFRIVNSEMLELMNRLKDNRLAGMTELRRVLYGIDTWKTKGLKKILFKIIMMQLPDLRTLSTKLMK